MYLSKADRSALEERVGMLSRAMLSGKIPFLEGCIELLSAGYNLDLYDDPDFLVIDEVVSEIRELPIGPERIHWSEAALQKAGPEIKRKEKWAMHMASEACEELARRFAT